jgi:lysophospholipase L1-like esterase
LSVKATNYSRAYSEGKDWKYKDGRLVFGKESRVPFFHPENLIFNKEIPGNSMGGKLPGTYVLFNEGSYFSAMQVSVTYIKERSESWNGPVPKLAIANLPNTMVRLKNRENLKVEFYGNSIEVGYNASGLEKAPPYMPVWPELVIKQLQKTYKGDVSFVNRSIAGRMVKWGLDSVASKVIVETPNLVIIGFGMNDGTMKVPADIYREQIKGIIDAVSASNPSTEFILIAPMLANPASGFDGLQSVYEQELDKLVRKGVVVADITGVHQELLKHKSYQDMTGNNINHPNDYLARWYAQYISGILINY